ncbi:MAG: Fic family protein [Bacteroides sp.]|nr:Fic family protein [Bacteroides sp.]MBD5339926.1 Fic family protein [Bacteroides sp.]
MTQLNNLYTQWVAVQPLSSDDEKRLKRKFMLDFNYNSNHIEGNTLTYGQTEVLLLLGEVIGSAKMKDLEEMKAHNICLNMVEQEALTDEPLTETFIRQVHKVMLREDYKVYRQLPGGETTSYTVHAGRYKTRPNSVITPTGERFEYASPDETPALMTDLVYWYNEAAKDGSMSPIQLAALFHYRYIRIHPFEDGNGRIARLMVNFILRRHKWPMMVIRSKNKKAYLNALALADSSVGQIPADGAHASLKSITPFVDYMKKALSADISAILEFLSGDRETMWWYEGEIIRFSTTTPGRILRVLQSDPNASLSTISTILGISRSAIQKQVDNLAEKGYISRPEGKKRGWIVNARNFQLSRPENI